MFVLAKTGDFLLNQFDGLRDQRSWENFYGHVTMNFRQANGFNWDTSEVGPANLNDLFWKTKVRVLSMHQVGLADVESQKRTASFSLAMMGIIPVNRIADNRVRDEANRIPAETNPSRCVFTVNGPPGSRTCRLLDNQARTLNVKICMLDANNQKNADPLTNKARITKCVKTFFQALSTKKANDASSAQERSWKDLVIHLCSNQDLKRCVCPTDFDQDFFRKLEDHVDTSLVAEPNIDDGTYIVTWAKNLHTSILQAMHTMTKSTFMSNALPINVNSNTASEFVKTVNGTCKAGRRQFFHLPTTNVPKPVAIHVLVHLFFLVGPAASTMEGNQKSNTGLINLLKVVKANGAGIMFPKLDDETFFQITDPSCRQSVSDADGPVSFVAHDSTSPEPSVSVPNFRDLFFVFTNPEIQLSGFVLCFYKSRNSTS
jgi:hypothetical protein